MGRIRSENWMECSSRTRAMSARVPPFEEYLGWGSTEAIPTFWDLGPGFPSCQAPNNIEKRDGVSTLLEGKGKRTMSERESAWHNGILDSPESKAEGMAPEESRASLISRTS